MRRKSSQLTGNSSRHIGTTQAMNAPWVLPIANSSGSPASLSTPNSPFSRSTQGAWRIAVSAASWSAKMPHSTTATTYATPVSGSRVRNAKSSLTWGATSTNPAPSTTAASALIA